MNRILLLALLGCAYIALAAGHEEEDQSLVRSEDAVAESRVVRSADPMPGKDNKKRGKKQRKGKKNKAAKKGKKNRKNKAKKSKKGKKARKGRKNRKNKKGKKKSRKMKKGKKSRKTKKGKKSRKAKKGKKSRKSKKGKKARKSKKAKKGSRSGSARQSCSADSDCLTLAMKYLKNVKDKVTNYQKQKKRIEKFDTVSGNKKGKKGNFNSLKTQLVEAGGGNASAPKCQGSSSSEGAKELKTALATFQKCESNINSSCSGAPAYNKTEATTCNTAMESFKTAVLACEKKSGSEACTCWKDSALATKFDAIKNCDLSAMSKSFAKFKSACTSAFSTCRSNNEMAAKAIFACSSANSQSKLLGDLKNLKSNSKALGNLKTAVDKASARARQGRQVRAASCSDYSTSVMKVASMAKAAPASSKIATEAQSLADSPPTSCTAPEKTALKTASTDLSGAVEAVTAATDSLQDTLKTLTGTTASSSAIDSGSTATKRYRRHAGMDTLLS